MCNNKFKNSMRPPWVMLSIFLAGLLLAACAQQRSQLKASQYRFHYGDSTYRIRSISTTDNKGAYNEIIGATFLAIDYDQDRVLDQMVMGEVPLSDAQKIYEHGLTQVSEEKKLQVSVPRIKRYVQKHSDFDLEIRSFRHAGEPPFNEFKITDKRPAVNLEITIFVDQNADGSLDVVLKGGGNLEDAQLQYKQMIETGLLDRVLVKTNGTILVLDN